HQVAEWMTADVPAEQEVTGQPRISIRQESQFEAVLGSRARSGEQFAIWEATYGPVASDGYPAELWDLSTGTIDRSVAEYFRAHDYDLRDYLERNWARLGRKLRGQKYSDRKSTRLNSSHVKISYAVFCLKKKKKNLTREI